MFACNVFAVAPEHKGEVSGRRQPGAEAKWRVDVKGCVELLLSALQKHALKFKVSHPHSQVGEEARRDMHS
eukprot:52398-Pelagomonas_calceolata.AAC.1